ncbi:hypothetical protein DFQ27_001308 [Actinomortierella ambigua]|uniref:PCI domain-containing protein n=1 Tax=Actinomortierella ambigua TaxID=1343610 RepID=A0A9P6U8Y5_9FUNG|nr:hypothetical protein DFQ27_001308 [Actinomortierella ambigua]
MDGIRAFLAKVDAVFATRNEDAASDLFTVDQDNATLGSLEQHLSMVSDDQIRRLCANHAEKSDVRGLADFVANYLLYCKIASNLEAHPVDVYAAMSALYGSFLSVFTMTPDAQWLAVVLMNFSSSIVYWAIQADYTNPNAKELKVSDVVGKHFNRALNIVISDKTGNPTHTSKKKALYYLANQSLRCYFRLHSTRLIPTLISNISKASVDLREYPMSEQVTHRYYLGRYHLYKLDLRKAEQNLAFAFRNCEYSDLDYPDPARGGTTASFRNQRLILIYLTACRLCLGILPKPGLLQTFGIDAYFAPLVHAVKFGDLRLLKRSLSLDDNGATSVGLWLVHKEIYFLLVEKLTLLCWRSLLRRMCLLTTSSSGQMRVDLRVVLQVIQSMLRTARAPTSTNADEDEEDEYDLSDIEAIVVSLLDQGYIRGYIHAIRKILVLGKTNPFPAVHSVEVHQIPLPTK